MPWVDLSSSILHTDPLAYENLISKVMCPRIFEVDSDEVYPATYHKARTCRSLLDGSPLLQDRLFLLRETDDRLLHSPDSIFSFLDSVPL